MAKIFLIGKKTIQAAISGAANFVVKANVGIKVTSSATLLAARNKVGLAITNVSAKLLTTQKPAIAILKAFAVGTARASVNAGIAASNRCTGSPAKPLQTPAFDVVQTTIQLVAGWAASSATEEAINAHTDWQNDANATGQPNSSGATITSNALGQRAGRLVLSYPASVNKTALTITKVELRFYVTQAGTVANNGPLKVGYRFGAGANVQLAAYTGNIAAFSPPQSFDITSVIGGDWSKIDSLKAYCEYDGAALNTANAACDAVVLYIEANRTEVN